VVDINGLLPLREQDALALPVAHRLGRAGVAVVGVVVAILILAQNDPYTVGGVQIIELLLQLTVDHVVRWSNHIAERTNLSEVVTDTRKGTDVGHGGEGRVGQG
jgi:hypothetical protein